MVRGCSCLCFFFFKQKTAYEMRISDWSPDVCSSDLPARNRRAGDTDAGEPEVSVLGLVHDLALADIERVDARQGDLHVGQAAVDVVVGICIPTGHDQIGRASSRERVCQYV